jgi:hypothetical protein
VFDPSLVQEVDEGGEDGREPAGWVFALVDVHSVGVLLLGVDPFETSEASEEIFPADG